MVKNMSTKIYNGLKLNISNINELKKELVEFNTKTLMPFYKKEYSKMIAALLTGKVDSARYKNKDNIDFKISIEETYHEIYKDVRDRTKEVLKTNRRDVEIDFDFNIVILPIENKTLAIVYSEQNSFVELFKGLPFVEEYGYWDNSDKPDEISEEDWQTRNKDWNEVFKDSSIPSKCGFTFKLIEGIEEYPDLNEVLSSIPNIEKRTKVIVSEKIWEEVYKTISEEEWKIINNGSWSRLMEKEQEFRNSPDYDAIKNSIFDEVSSYLVTIDYKVD